MNTYAVLCASLFFFKPIADHVHKPMAYLCVYTGYQFDSQ